MLNLLKRIFGCPRKVEPVYPKQDVSVSKVVQRSRPDIEEQSRKANRKGELGEYKVDLQFSRLPKKYRYLNDLLFKTKWGYSQIDHVVVTPAGLFIVETKNYFGHIFGKPSDEKWTIRSGKKTLKIYSPLEQNATHIRVVKGILKYIDGVRFYSVISFTGRCTLDGIDQSLRIPNADTRVVFDISIMESIIKKSRIVLEREKKSPLSEENIDRICKLLREANVDDPEARAEHVRRIKEKYKIPY